MLISVSADADEQKWREFVDKKSMEWPQYRDSKGQIQKSFGIHAFPSYILIDTEGIIRQQIVGENPQQSIVHRLKDSLASLSLSANK